LLDSLLQENKIVSKYNELLGRCHADGV